MRLPILLSGVLALCGSQIGRLHAQSGPSTASFARPSAPGSHGAVHSNRGQSLPSALSKGATSTSMTARPASHSNAVAGGAPSSTLSAAADSDDIANIVRACQSDPARLFDFVHNNVRFQPYFGFRKGADLTWLSRSGNDADQAELLVTLLRAAGYPQAQYVYGRLSLPTTAAYAWFGADNDTALDQLTGSAGYPEGVSGSTFLIEMVWVSVNVNGTTYQMMPAYKTFTTLPGIDLAAASNYSPAALRTAAGGTVTATAVQGVSTPGVTGYLRDRATALVSTIRANYPNASVEEIVGGRLTIQAELTDLAQAFPPVLSVQATAPPFADPPDGLCETLDMVVGTPDGNGGLSSVNAEVYRTSRVLGGSRLSLTFAADGHAQLWIDDDLAAEEPAGSNGSIALGLAINHPYYDGPDPNNPYNLYDETRIVPVQRGGSYSVLVAHGGEDNGLLAQRRRTQVEAYQRAGLALTSREVVTESLNLLGLDWAKQWTAGVELLSRQNRFEPIYHHTLAVFSQENAFNVDIPATTVTLSRDGDLTKTYANLRAALLLGSAAEHACIEQNYPGKNAVSTVRYVTRNNAAGNKTYFATSANYSTIQNDADFRNGWGSYYADAVFPNYFASSNPPPQLIIPQNGAQQIDQLFGNGYYVATESSVAAIISNPQYTANGGHSTTTGQVDPNQNRTPTDGTKGPKNGDNPESDEPIDLLTGAYVMDHADLTLGGEDARGLSLVRTYSSDANGVSGDFGPGWNHSYHTSLAQHTDSAAAYGRTTPVAAAAMISVNQALTDLMRNDSGDAQGWVVASIAVDWGTTLLRNNTVTVVTGRKTLGFTLLADGSYAPAAGITAQLIQDSGTGLFRVAERFGRTTYFDAQRRVSSFVDADGQTLTYAYDGTTGTLNTVTDTYGRNLTFTYQGAGAARRLQSISDSTGRSVAYGYDTSNRLASVTDPDGGVSAFGYDSADRLATYTDENNQPVVLNAYDSTGRVSTQTAEGEAAQVWSYAFTGLRNAATNPAGNTSLYLYDGKGRQTGMVNGVGERTIMAYDGQDQLIASTDGRNNTTGYQYDGLNNLRFVTNANGHTSELAYDALNHLDHLVDAAGKTTVFTYDAHHHMSSVTDARQRQTTLNYPSSGLLQQIVEPGGDTTTFTYDANGQIATTTRPDTSVVTTTDNALGDLLYSKITVSGDPNIHAQTSTYNHKRQLLTTRDALGYGVTNAYDPRGRLRTQTDRFGNVNRLTYSPWGRLQSVTAPSGAVTVYRNDSTGRRDRLTNALSQVTTYGYDAADRLARSVDALTQPTTLGYDASGNRNALTNPRIQTWGWTYGAVNLPASLTTPLGRVTTYGYDQRELLAQVQLPSGAARTTTLTYWEDTQLKQSTDPLGAVAYDYDPKGRLKTVSEGNAALVRLYDPLNRVSQFTDAGGKQINYTYDGASNLSTLIYPGNVTVSYAYDSADRLQTVTDWAGRSTSYVYDSHSRLARINLPNGTRRLFTYDAAGRLRTLSDQTSAGALIHGRTLDYDVLDRVAKEAVTPEPVAYSVPLPATMTYDNDDRLSSWNGQTASSDPDGNLTTGPVGGAMVSLAYDARNRLNAVGSTAYGYDAENRRMSQTNAGVVTSYVYDPNGPLSRLLMRSRGNATTRYVYDDTGLLLYEDAGGSGNTGVKTYHFDGRGSTVALADSSGQVSDRVVYGAYGETVNRTGTTDTPFLFHGAWGVQSDSSNGLLYMRARYYSVESRRFLNADPTGFDGGMNWYAFVTGDPINGTDPFGLDTLILVHRNKPAENQQARDASGMMMVFHNGQFQFATPVNQYGYQEGSHGIYPGNYSVIPRTDADATSHFPNGQPSVTAPGEAVAGDAGHGYHNVYIHPEANIPGGDSRGCQTIDRSAVTQIKALMDEDQKLGQKTSLHIYNYTYPYAIPVKR